MFDTRCHEKPLARLKKMWVRRRIGQELSQKEVTVVEGGNAVREVPSGVLQGSVISDPHGKSGNVLINVFDRAQHRGGILTPGEDWNIMQEEVDGHRVQEEK